MKRSLFSLQTEVRQLHQKAEGLRHLNEQDEILGMALRFQQRSAQDELVTKKAALAQARHEFIQGVQHLTRRAYKELPHFFKFCLFKTRPRRFKTQGRAGEFIEPIKETIDFRGIQAQVTYFQGELGDTDRLVYLAILNEAIRHKEFVCEFGKIPFSLSELADKAGFSSCHHRKEWVEESLDRLRHTSVHFSSGFGEFRFKDQFHLIESASTLEKVKVVDEVRARLTTTREQALLEQANTLLEKFKPRTPKLMLVKFNEPLMEALQGHQITTVDMWALSRLSGNPARSLYLYLWDVSQWRDSPEPLELSLLELLTLMDLTLSTYTKNGKEYARWKRAKEQAEATLNEVNQVAQFIDWLEWQGENENTRLVIKLSKDTLQIPQL
jgi:hypothetical protein